MRPAEATVEMVEVDRVVGEQLRPRHPVLAHRTGQEVVAERRFHFVSSELGHVAPPFYLDSFDKSRRRCNSHGARSTPMARSPQATGRQGGTMGVTDVRRDDGGGVITVTLTRDEKMNAMTPVMFEVIEEASATSGTATISGCS